MKEPFAPADGAQSPSAFPQGLRKNGDVAPFIIVYTPPPPPISTSDKPVLTSRIIRHRRPMLKQAGGYFLLSPPFFPELDLCERIRRAGRGLRLPPPGGANV